MLKSFMKPIIDIVIETLLMESVSTNGFTITILESRSISRKVTKWGHFWKIFWKLQNDCRVVL